MDDRYVESGAVNPRKRAVEGVDVPINPCSQPKWIFTDEPTPSRIIEPRPVDRPYAFRRSRSLEPNAVAAFGHTGRRWMRGVVL